MHILFFSHYFPPEVNAPATRTFEHARRWVELGHRVTVVTCAPNCPSGVVFEGYRNAWRVKEKVEGIDVLRVWSYVSPNKGLLRRTLSFLSYMVTATWQGYWMRDVDLVVATSPQFFCGWAGVWCGWLRRWPFVLEIRDIWPESIVTVGAMKRSWMMRVLEWLERRMYAAADHIVTVGEGYREQLLGRGVPEGKISVIPNGVDLRRFRPRAANEELRRRWDGEGKFVCAYVGTVGMAHGLEVVVEAAELLRQRGRNDVQFWIVGDGAERERLEHEVRERGLSSITFTGMIPKGKIDDVIASCDACLVHLRRTELFGTVIPSKVFETMALNVPIIMGVRGQAQQIVLEGKGGVAMTPEDPASLLEALDRIRKDPAPYRGGRGYVARHFDRTALADEMLGVLKRFGDSSTPSPPASRQAA